jgi:hypothetical protein
MRLERIPHSGQSLSGSAARARTTISASISVTLSTTSPAGIKDEIRIFIVMLLIPFRKQHHLATKYHRE